MWDLLKKKVSPQVAAKDFVELIVLFSRRSFDRFRDRLIENLLQRGVPNDFIEGLRSEELEAHYIAMIAAFEASAIINLFDEEKYMLIYDEIKNELNDLGFFGEILLGYGFLTYWDAIREGLRPLPDRPFLMPNDAVFGRWLAETGLAIRTEIQTVMDGERAIDPFFMLAMSAPIVDETPAYWKRFSQKHRIST